MAEERFHEVEFYMTTSLKNPTHPHSSLAVPKVTRGKPSIPRGHIALQFKLRVPAALFREFIPSGTISLPADATIGRSAVEVEVPEGLEVRPGVRLMLVPFQDLTEGPTT